VILFNYVVQVRRWSTAAVAAQFAGPLQIGDYLWVRRMPIDVDHPRPDLTSVRESQSKEVFGSNRIALGESMKSIVWPKESTAR